MFFGQCKRCIGLMHIGCVRMQRRPACSCASQDCILSETNSPERMLKECDNIGSETDNILSKPDNVPSATDIYKRRRSGLIMQVQRCELWICISRNITEFVKNPKCYNAVRVTSDTSSKKPKPDYYGPWSPSLSGSGECITGTTAGFITHQPCLHPPAGPHPGSWHSPKVTITARAWGKNRWSLWYFKEHMGLALQWYTLAPWQLIPQIWSATFWIQCNIRSCHILT